MTGMMILKDSGPSQSTDVGCQSLLQVPRFLRAGDSAEEVTKGIETIDRSSPAYEHHAGSCPVTLVSGQLKEVRSQ